MKNGTTFLILLLLAAGIIFRLLLTSNGNFLFHIDNARDMVDLREMAVLHHVRLIGPTSGIEGLYNGPLWYYITLIPFIISGGNPYSLIILEIIFWAIGGWFLLITLSKWGVGVVLAIGTLWIGSNLLILSTENSLSPNPILFLMPLFIWLVEKSLTKKDGLTKYYVYVWILVGLFFNFEMAFGLLLPLILFIIYQFNQQKFYKSKRFLIAIAIFSIFLLPQFIFDVRHDWIMLHSVLSFLQHNSATSFNPFTKLIGLIYLYNGVLLGLLMNNSYLLFISVAVIFVGIYYIRKKRHFDKTLVLAAIFFIIPFLIYVVLPISVMSWHIIAEAALFLFLLGVSLGYLQKFFIPKFASLIVIAIICFVSVININNFLLMNHLENDSALYRNQIAAIDYVYTQAKGQNFKVYNYLPSVIDYPYQYLFWWYGLNKYGYTPIDYAYLPNQPEYIYSKIKFNKIKEGESSNLIFLIKEPDRVGLRHLWENSFKGKKIIKKTNIGPFEIETRQD